MVFPTPKDLTKRTTPYFFALSDETADKAKKYLEDVQQDINKAGRLLKQELEGVNVNELDVLEFIRHIINTKKPKNFAEQILTNPEARGEPGSGYNNNDLEILARIGTVFESYAYNDGGHAASFKDHKEALPCLMGYVSAPLFTENRGSLDDVMLTEIGEMGTRGGIYVNNYNREIEQRILPTLLQMDIQAGMAGKRLKVTIPGLGCGLFGGPYGDLKNSSVIYTHLSNALKEMLKKHGTRLTNIAGISFDTYRDVFKKEEKNIGGVDYQCFSSSRGEGHKQLELSGEDKDNNDIMLGTIVAADLLSWAGNDMWNNSRHTDEGVKGGSTLTLVQIACSLNPTHYEFEHFEYKNGAFYHREKSWAEIARDLKHNCSYAPKTNFIAVHRFDAIQWSDNYGGENDAITETSVKVSVEDNALTDDLSQDYEIRTNTTLDDEITYYSFNFNLLLGLSAMSVASLVVGVLALTAIITAPLGFGIGMLSLGCAFGIGATCFGLFNKKNVEESGAAENPEQQSMCSA